jgi:hypothetical protein
MYKKKTAMSVKPPALLRDFGLWTQVFLCEEHSAVVKRVILHDKRLEALGGDCPFTCAFPECLSLSRAVLSCYSVRLADLCATLAEAGVS